MHIVLWILLTLIAIYAAGVCAAWFYLRNDDDKSLTDACRWPLLLLFALFGHIE